MNRRTLLGRFVFGAAAVLGCGMVAPKAEAAQGCPDQWCPCHFDVSPAQVEQLKADAYNQGRAIAEARIESRLAEGLPIKRGALTFDEMVADCAARGCSISAVNAVGPGQWFVTHKTVPAESGSLSQYLPFFQVDAWRRSLHGTAVRQKDLGTQIAESRRLRGARPFFFTD